MKRELIFDCAPDWLRAAVVEDGVLCELHSEPVGSLKATESLFYGRVEQIRPSVGAAFVNIGLERNGFLPLDELGDAPLRCGDMLIVQGAARQETEGKGLRLTVRVNLAGKGLVLVPGGSGAHVSKKVKDAQARAQLLEAAQALCPEGCGLIVRTASQDVTMALLEEEADMLFGQWQDAKRRAAGMTRPGVLMERLPLDRRLVRDMAGRELHRIVTNSAESAEAYAGMQRGGLIPDSARIERFEETEQLIFDALGIEPQIDRALKKRVWLPCGGYLIIDRCEAMTVIDVNSGKMILGRSTEDTALRVNFEAAREVARQMRLRDMGGMVVVDFIDMALPEHREALVRALRDAAKEDRAQVKVFGLTQLGLMELTRKRVHAELHRQLCAPCTYCAGTGEVLSPDEVARRALYAVRRKALSGQPGPYLVRLSPAAARALSGRVCPGECAVYALGVPGRHAETFDIEPVDPAAGLPKGAVRLAERMEA